MTDRIFEAFAPVYWAAGLPVIPLRERNKMPDINQWPIFGTRMPDHIEQAHWLASFPRGNVGLPLGPASGLCIIDIDTEDEALTAAIREVCGPTPWVRIGQKGMALAYKFEGQKNFKLRAADGGMLCEFLGNGNQVVLPPSIHPKTQLPYVANTNLWEVLDQIPYLGEDIEDKLRAVLGAKGYELGAGGRSSPLDVIPAGERDVQMVRHAGYLARVVLGIDKSATFGLFDAIMQMHTWVEHFTAKVSGDAMDPNKGVAKLLEFLIKDLEKGRTMPRGWDAGLPVEWREHATVKTIAQLNEAKRWTAERAIAHFNDMLCDDLSSDGVIHAIESILGKVAKDPHFSAGHQTALIEYINRHCKADGFKIPQLNKMLKQASKPSVSEQDSHRLAAEEALEQLQRIGEIRHDHGQFWQWNGASFASFDEDAIYLHIANNVTSNPLVRRNSDYKAVVEVLARMCSNDLVQSIEKGVNFANGYLNTSLDLLPHDPKYGATFTLPFEYDRDNATRCNRWLEFLASCWGQEEDFEQRVMALQEMFAVTLFGIAPTYQRAFLLFGRAGTGKTQILKVLRALLPPNAVAQVGPQRWGEQFQLVPLIGKIANIVGELPENGRIAGSVFKEVVEGSEISDSFKGKDVFSFTPIASHWFASNYLPVSQDSSRGFTRRWLILDFKVPVRDEDKIENLAEIIVEQEREAIAAWAVEGLARVHSNRRYTEPRCHREQLHRVRRQNNSVFAFLEDNRSFHAADGNAKVRDVYDHYAFHMRDFIRGVPVSFERFMQMLEDLGYDVYRDAIGDYFASGLIPRIPK